jgi:hypothetical protein
MSDNVVNITGGNDGDGPTSPRMDQLDRQDLINRRLAQIDATLHMVRFAMRCRDAKPAEHVVIDCIWGLNDMIDEVQDAFEALTETKD